MSYETLRVAREGAIATVSFNRPDSLNAIDAGIRRDILAAIREVNADDAARVAILTGEGRAFCAGADLTETGPGEPTNVTDLLENEYKPALMAIRNARKPWISAVNGAAAGIGSAFAMSCDLTVMAEDAYLYQAFAAIGLIPDGGATWHLARAVGRKKAYELMALGEKLKAADCLALGLCNRVAPAGRLLDEARALAAELADKAPLSLRYAKESLNYAMESGVEDVISNEARLQHYCVVSEDAREGARAFMQKRPARFKGK